MKSTSCNENRTSILLSEAENEQIFKLVGYKCLTLAITVVQLFATEGPECTQWKKKEAGVLCLVRDTNKRSYFFRIFCLVRNKMIWEHEIYNDMKYLAPRPYLHTFEGEERIIAFNFANENEAALMRNILLEKLKAKEQNRQGRKNKNQVNPCISAIAAPARPAPTPNFNALSNGYVKTKNKSSKSKKSGKKSKKKSISKGDIGTPQNFQHVAHVGFDKDTGFKMENMDVTLREFFVKAGISDTDLQDKKTRDYIYDFIDKHGGYDAVKENVQFSPPLPPPPPRVPSRYPSSKPPSVRQAPLPQPPLDVVRTERMHPAPPPPPIEPPPPNVIIQKSYDSSKKLDAIHKPDTFKRASQPPPPPPIPPAITPETFTATQIPNSNAAVQNSVPDARSALLESIRSCPSLKHVEIPAKPEDNSRDKLLDQIRQGVELKSVAPVIKTPKMNGSDLAIALARALAERKEVMNSDTSSSSESEDSDQEWDD